MKKPTDTKDLAQNNVRETNVAEFDKMAKEFWAMTKPKLLAKNLSADDINQIEVQILFFPVFVAKGFAPEDVRSMLDLLLL